MTIPRPLLGVPAIAGAALMLAAQLILASMPAAETGLERIRLSPDAWTAAHILIGAALVCFLLAGVALLSLARSLVGVVAFVALAAGAVVSAMTNGVDAVLGVLSGIGADGAIHRAIAEHLVQPLDIWDAAMTVGLVALVALVHVGGTVPWWGTSSALVGLAVPALTDLRVVAPALMLIGFIVLTVSLRRTATGARPALGVVVAFVPAAFLSVERAVLLVVVLAIVGVAYWRSVQRGVRFDDPPLVEPHRQV